MQPESRDAALLWEMRNAVRETIDIVAGISYETFSSSIRIRWSVERGIEIVGEAARQLSAEFKASTPQVPWRGVIGLRTVLAHDYATIRPETLWGIASDRLPELLSYLDALLPPEPPDDAP